ncbi:arylamine N-acetyltransferase [Paenibacillus sp. N1-5-1-14]|uniref:arylamine N-acetyltransferase family protein n=1 Tax=Paenibacillus radicibacter TaxID=2972488 RepID=UPI0021593DE8|nr:arylamine N-acetyltransferase [Paenibacillus radicibacter]MCR8644572.1 arylamine N-acetyltransferase [Paenibacillus radicibacter]
MLTHAEIRNYLARLGIQDICKPSLEFLTEIHKAHVENLSWQTIDIVAGRPAPMDIRSSVDLILNGRSGYCFQLNSAFGQLLHSLGYNVSWHRAGVQPTGQKPCINSFHLGLTVTLPNEHEKPQQWIVDVGLGDMPYEPLPLVPGHYNQGGFEYTVVPSNVTEGGWRLEHDPLAAYVGVDYAPQSLENLNEFLPKHEFYSYSPESPWLNLFLIRHRHASGSNELRGCIWSKREGTSIEKEEVATKSQWLEVLGDVFHEKLVSYSKLAQDELWKKVYGFHEEWKRSKQVVK